MYPTRDLTVVDLTEFVAGFPGTQIYPLFGADFRVVDVLVYRDGLAVDWVIRPNPDLSSITAELSDDDHRFIARLNERLRYEATEGRLFGRRLWILLDAATLSDDVGTEYYSGSRGSHSVKGGTTGRFEFAPAPPKSAAQVVLEFGGLTVSTPLLG